MDKARQTQIKWVNGVDSIRFFLALIVLLSHIPNVYANILKTSNTGILRIAGSIISPAFSGISAVIAFFIISGFVIHYPNKNSELNVKKFLLRRWVRIGVPLIVIAVVADMYDSFFMLPVWSLYCELIYYTIYPILKKINISWKALFAGAFVLSYIVIAIFAPGVFQSFFHQKQIDFLGQYWHLGVGLTWLVGLPCWLLGVILAEQFDTIQISPSTAKVWRFRVFVFACSVLTTVLRFKFFASWLLTENLFGLILFFWLRNEIAYYKFNTSMGVFERLGKFSYSLYLCHGLLVMALGHFLPYNGYTYPLYIILVIGFSYIVYLLVEYPSHWLAQKLTKKKTIPLTVPLPAPTEKSGTI